MAERTRLSAQKTEAKIQTPSNCLTLVTKDITFNHMDKIRRGVTSQANKSVFVLLRDVPMQVLLSFFMGHKYGAWKKCNNVTLHVFLISWIMKYGTYFMKTLKP